MTLRLVKDYPLFEQTYDRSMKELSQYFIKKDHQIDDSYFLITSQPKKISKYINKGG